MLTICYLLAAYSFLDPSDGPILAAYIIGIAVGDILVFALVRGVVALRQRWAIRSGRLRSASDGEVGGAGEAIDEWEEVERPVMGSGKTDGAPRVIDSGVGEGEAV